MNRSIPALLALISSALGLLAADLNLPDPLTCLDGSKVTNVEQWTRHRRGEILDLFRTQVYGRAPVGRPASLKFAVTDTKTSAMDGKANRKLVDISYAG